MLAICITHGSKQSIDSLYFTYVFLKIERFIRARSFYPTCCGLFDDDEDYDDGCIYYENTSFFFANYTIPVKRFKSTYEFLLTKKSSLYTSSSKPPHKKPHKEQLKEIVALQHWMLNRLLSLLRLLSDPQYYGNVSNVLASKLALK
ncbi:hypothetical protein GJ496_009540, partial [Pomphorhynchus laevis]